MNPFMICQEGFDPQSAAREESLFAQGNGYLGWRGNYEEGYEGALGVEGCYINGFHETEKIRYGEIAYGYAEDSQTMLNLTGSQRILAEAEGVALHPDGGRLASSRRELDMERGLVRRETVYALETGRVSVSVRRLVSLRRSHGAAIAMTVTALDAPCAMTLTPLMEGDVTNLVCTDDPRVGSGLHGRVLSLPVMAETDAAMGMAQHTGKTRLSVACAMACRVSAPVERVRERTKTCLRERYRLQLRAGGSATLTKYIAYFNGGEAEEAALLTAALGEAETLAEVGFDALAAEQEEAMRAFWEGCGIWVEGDDALLQGLRFNLFHLLQSAGKDGKTNIAAKGLTGEGYEGHYFWDTETYIFPMFLHVAPEVARALLTYRYGILPCARKRAREMGHPVGALYPWRTINGQEASAYYPAGTAQVHINADIALAVKRYVEATGDWDFIWDMGAEMVCETARLYLDLGFYNARKGGRFCLNGVTGPDEYNAIVDNNAYTNIMAAVNLAFAADVLARMAQEVPQRFAALTAKLGLAPGEPDAWREAAQSMYIPRDEATGLIWQDDGFMDRTPWPLKDIPKENFPLLLHYHPLVIYRHQVCKQADTVLAMLLLPHLFTQAEKEAAFTFYDGVTTHDSSLSMAAFSAVASRIGRMDKAYAYFRETARLDLDDTHGNTRDGLHMANMAGTWVCVASGFGGMQVDGEGIAFAPVLPEELKGYGFRVQYRGSVIEVRVDGDGPRYRLISGDSVTIRDRGRRVTLTR
mgnify:CR=1 FL=1